MKKTAQEEYIAWLKEGKKWACDNLDIKLMIWFDKQLEKAVKEYQI